MILAIIGIIFLIVIITGISHVLYVYSEYKSLIQDSLTINNGTKIGLLKNIQELYHENFFIFTVTSRDKKTLQTHWLYSQCDCYLNTYYIIVHGYSIYLHGWEYIKYWFWIKYTIKKHRRLKDDKNRSLRDIRTD